MMIINKIKEKALNENIPIIMDDTLEVIAKYLLEIKPKRILEIGTAVGYSAICFSQYLHDGGIIDTIERDEERIKEAKINIKEMNLEDRIHIYEGDAVEILPTLKEEYGATLVGKHTYGKGTVQELKTLPDGEQYKFRSPLLRAPVCP